MLGGRNREREQATVPQVVKALAKEPLRVIDVFEYMATPDRVKRLRLRQFRVEVVLLQQPRLPAVGLIVETVPRQRWVHTHHAPASSGQEARRRAIAAPNVQHTFDVRLGHERIQRLIAQPLIAVV